MEHLLSIVRRPGGMAGLVVTWEPGGAPKAGAALETLPRPSVHERPIGEMRPARRWSALAGAWRRLARSAPARPDVLADALMVLLETRRAEEEPRMLPPLDVAERVRVRPTAAHPRVYRGTKHRPPRVKQPEPIDLRPYLCDARGELALLRGMRRYLGGALDRLTAHGYAADRLAHVAMAVDRGSDIPIAYHFGAHLAPGRLPAQFATHLLPALQAWEWKQVRELLALHFTLGLDDDTALLHALAVLLTTPAGTAALAWCRLLPAQPPERRAALAALIRMTGADEQAPPKGTEVLLDELAASPADQYAHRTHGALCGLARGSSPWFLRQGVLLANRTGKAPDLAAGGDCSTFSLDAVWPLLEGLPYDEAWTGTMLWEASGALPGLYELVLGIDWHPFNRDERLELLSVFFDARYAGDEDRPAAWAALLAHAQPIIAGVARAPASHHARLLDFFDCCTWEWRTAGELEEHLPDAIRLAGRIGSPPMTAERLEPWAFVRLIDGVGTGLRSRILAAPDASFRAFESACRSRNRATSVARGMTSLLLELGGHTVGWFFEAPARLFQAARLLGTLNREHRRQLLRVFARHPILDPALLGRPLEELCALLGSIRTGTNPIPRALRGHLEGRATLSPGKLERARRVLAEKLPLVQLQYLEEEVLRALGGERLGAPLRPPSDAVVHALAMVGGADENRRTFRRFLHAFWRGETDWLLRHPSNRMWLRRHPRVDATLWMHGIVTVADVDGVRLELRLETRPIEALRLGSLVGSCLGVGGEHAYSAVGTVLDVNKQVIFGRDPRGVVRGRQIVAISEQEELVCFEVYPVGASTAMKHAFRAYDEAFASALGLCLHRPATGVERYRIAQPLSTDWYDDGAWDLDVPAPAGANARSGRGPGSAPVIAASVRTRKNRS